MLLDRKESFATKELGIARSYLSEILWPHSFKMVDRNADIDFRHHMVDFGKNTSLHTLSYGGEIINEGTPSDNSYLVLFTLGGAIEIEGQGYNLTSKAGTVCVMNPNQRFRSHLSADHSQFTLKIDGLLLNNCFEEAFGYLPSKPLEFLSQAVPVKKQASGLGGALKMICAELNNNESSILRPPISSHMERVLAGLLIEELTHNHTSLFDNRSLTPAPRYIKIAQEYIHAHASEYITIEEVAKISQVTMRALQAGFRKYLNATPLRYLRNVRLDMANNELSNAASRGLNVTDVAFNCGFSSSSKFAQYYRDRFGCYPSNKLRGYN